jgi:hypothetical protein
MARRRVIDWKKSSRSLKRKSWVEKLTWFGLLGSVDDFGLCYWSPVQIGQMFMEEELNGRKVSVKSIEACIPGSSTGSAFSRSASTRIISASACPATRIAPARRGPFYGNSASQHAS